MSRITCFDMRGANNERKKKTNHSSTAVHNAYYSIYRSVWYIFDTAGAGRSIIRETYLYVLNVYARKSQRHNSDAENSYPHTHTLARHVLYDGHPGFMLWYSTHVQDYCVFVWIYIWHIGNCKRIARMIHLSTYRWIMIKEILPFRYAFYMPVEMLSILLFKYYLDSLSEVINTYFNCQDKMLECGIPIRFCQCL